MRYSKVYLESFGYHLPQQVVSTAELEDRLLPLYKELHIAPGQLEAMTGISERRFWEPGYSVTQGALEAARKAIAKTNVKPEDIEVVIYAAVCRENFEPASACYVAAGLGVSPHASVFDISNACLGVLNGIIDIANRVELGQIRAGLVVSCETSREIIDTMIQKMMTERDMETFKSSLATLTGGSGAVAVLVTDGSFSKEYRRKLIGGTTQAAPQHHGLCKWGLAPAAFDFAATAPAAAMGHMLNLARQVMSTDSVAVLKHGVDLGLRNWRNFLHKFGWASDLIDKVICHQVGTPHRDMVFKALGIDRAKDFSTYPYLGNSGTVSLPLTAALAEERGFLKPGDRVGFLGIGSGLNCLMLGIDW